MQHSGWVLKSTGSNYIVETSEDKQYTCTLRGFFRTKNIRSTNPIAVGDKVIFTCNNDKSEGVITEILPRDNYLKRRATKLSKSSHIIASNFDCFFIIASVMQPRTSTGFIDRLLINAEAFHIPVNIVFNKYDIYTDKAKQRYLELKKIYTEVGYNVITTSTVTNLGIDEIKGLLEGKISLFTGHSGVGKSALLNSICPDLNLKTGSISEYHNKGKHTTTFAEMHYIEKNTYIIDTPGIKEFGLIDFDDDELHERYPEFRRFAHMCNFNNCTHIHEPNCAVISALKENLISEERYNNYLNILSELQ